MSDAAHDRAIALAQVAQRDRQIAELRKQMEKQSAELAQMKATQDQLASDLRNSSASKDELAKRQAELDAKFAAAQDNVQTSQQKLDGLLKQSSDGQARVTELTATVNTLTKELNDRNQALEQKDELLAKDRDIRELMGARDLHVAEVYDVARTGETQKPYGRVFFTEGKSLIFYAYDLDQEPEVKKASTFQVLERVRWLEGLPLKPDPEPLVETAEPRYMVPGSEALVMTHTGIPLDEVEDLLLGSAAYRQASRILLPKQRDVRGRPLTPLHGGHVGLLCTAGMLNGVFGEGENRHIAHWRSVKFTDHWGEEEEDGTRILHDRERFSHELTLVFSSGRTQILTHEKKESP